MTTSSLHHDRLSTSPLSLAPARAVEGARKWFMSSEATWPARYRARLWASDFAVILLAVGAAVLLPVFTSNVYMEGGVISALLPFVIIVSWFGALSFMRTRDVRAVGTATSEYKRVVRASAMTFGLLAIGLQALDLHPSRGFFIVVLTTGLLGLLGERWFWRTWLSHRRLAGEYLSSAIVVGSRDDVQYVVDQIGRNPDAGYRVDGAATDDSDGGDFTSSRARVHVVANLDEVASAARAMDVDTVVVAGPQPDPHFVKNLAWKLEGTRADLVLASRLADVAGPRIHFRPVEGLPLVHVELPQYEGGKHVVKRVLDLSVSLVALILLSPVFLAIAIIVRLDSDGPAIFSQLRVGRNGESFRMYKFRSMGVDAEAQLDSLSALNEGSGALFKLRSDPRVTKVGRVLRKYSLDELPQLFNIIRGDMSLVGPRPPLGSEVEEYVGAVHRRLFIKPGLTGMWQVNGRSDLDWEESVRLDLYYVENWSLTGDLLILWRTVRVVLAPRGAY